MKKITLSLAVASVFVANAALAYDSTINFTGKVIDQTCEVAAGSQGLTVTLPTVSKTVLNGPGKTAGLTPFNIKLSNCSAAANGINSVKLHFEPSANINTTTHNLKNTQAAGPQQVEIQLVNGDDPTQAINLGEANQAVHPVQLSAGDVTLKYYAQYYATAQADAGDVASTVNYTIAYE